MSSDESPGTDMVADLSSGESRLVYETYEQFPRENRAETQLNSEFFIKDEVYVATGIGAGLLAIAIIISLVVIVKFKMKKWESRDLEVVNTSRETLRADIGQSFQIGGDDSSSLNKIYSLIKPSRDGKETWLNPLAHNSSEAGSQASRPTTSTVDTISDPGEEEDRARSAGDIIQVDLNQEAVAVASNKAVEANKIYSRKRKKEGAVEVKVNKILKKRPEINQISNKSHDMDDSIYKIQDIYGTREVISDGYLNTTDMVKGPHHNASELEDHLSSNQDLSNNLSPSQYLSTNHNPINIGSRHPENHNPSVLSSHLTMDTDDIIITTEMLKRKAEENMREKLKEANADILDPAGRLLRETYSGGTFRKSMNYYSFRGSNDTEEPEIYATQAEVIERDSLDVSITCQISASL